MYYFYGKINRGQASRPLYRGCPLFGGSVIRGFTVYYTGPLSCILGCNVFFSMLII